MLIFSFLLNSAEVWCVQLNDSVVDIAHMPEGKVFAALADGSIAVLQVLCTLQSQTGY